MKVVYIDVLFLINFCMDFLTLWFCGSLLHLPRRRLPLFLASALGGAYAALEAVFSGNPTVSLVIGLGAAFLLCFIAYGRDCRARLLLTLFALFFGVS
ncbi:MAG: sigma-E processing peptidase SpoIIGA, partial [Clostridia bacterium]|nr:sigma-E processing peptidase SpoIIGA [Clostridia bacterium]